METTITLPLDVLPEAKGWTIGEAYKVKMVLEQVGLTADSATFEVIDATSLEPGDDTKRALLNSDGGMYMGK